MKKPTIICLTPVRNEAWILDTFLKCTSLWADYIIIADQQSTDGSREIASKYPKVILIDNPSPIYDEVARQRILLAEARKIEGKKLLITIDADEFLTSNYAEKLDWQQMMTAPVGSFFGFRRINLYPGIKKCWIPEEYFPWAYMDDGAEHQGKEMHNPRVPIKDWNSMIKLRQIRVMHYQYVNWRRMKSKNRFYQCLERINSPAKNAVDIYRMYHQMDNIPSKQIMKINQRWFKGYESNNISVKGLFIEDKNWFDDEIVKLFTKHSHDLFKREAIWHKRWEKPYNDPRSLLDKIVQRWLAISQPYHHTKWVNNIDLMIKNRIWKQE